MKMWIERFLFALAVLFTTGSFYELSDPTSYNSDNIGFRCHKLKMIQSPYGYNRTDLKNAAIACIFEDYQNHSIDIFELISSQTDVNVSTDRYTYVDIYLNCSAANYMRLSNFADKSNMHLITALRLKDCFVSYLDLNKLGSALYLIELSLVYINVQPPILPYDVLYRDYSGLNNIMRVSVSINFAVPKIVKVEKIIPPFSTITHLVITCVNKYFDTLGCNNTAKVFVDLQWLKNHSVLQNLRLSGVRVLKKPAANVDFPWTNISFNLPLNLTFSTFRTRKVKQALLPLSKVERMIYLGDTQSFTLENVCPPRELNVILLINLTSNPSTVPKNCFQNSRNVSEIEIYHNNFESIDPKLFSGLIKLWHLNLKANQLKFLRQGTFDDLVQLQILNLRYNQLTYLESGIFKNLESLEIVNLFNNSITHIEDGSFPIHSMKLNFIDMRRNYLKSVVTDCLKLPKLRICDLDENEITLNNLREILNKHFDPIQLYLFEPMAYNGEPLNFYEGGIPREGDESRISLRKNSITGIPINLTVWSEFELLQFGALLSFTQLDLSTNNILCDCNMYDMKRLIYSLKYHQETTNNPLWLSRYRDTKLYTVSNFQSWECHTHSLIGSVTKSFIATADEDYLCNITDSDPLCPKLSCYCYVAPRNNRVIIDCSHRGLDKVPAYLPKPRSIYGFIVSLKNNSISRFPSCENFMCSGPYEWLHYTTSLDLEDNILQPEGGKQDQSSNFAAFLNLLTKVEILKLAYNSIETLPTEIQQKNFTNLTIAVNNIQCNCHNKWMKDWLQRKHYMIVASRSVTCAGGSHPIVELTDEDFDKLCPHTLFGYALLSLFCIPVILIVIVSFIYKRKVNLIIFEKFGLKLMDRVKQDPKKKYAALLVYADTEFQWARNTLLDILELKRGYRIADHIRERDYGRGSAESSCELLVQSQRVILVLSNGFLADDDCMRIFTEARSFGENKRFVLLVKTESLQLDPENSAHRDISNFIETKFYVDVRREDRCIARLCYWMPDPKQSPGLTDDLPEETNTNAASFPNCSTAVTDVNENSPLLTTSC